MDESELQQVRVLQREIHVLEKKLTRKHTEVHAREQMQALHARLRLWDEWAQKNNIFVPDYLKEAP